MTKKTYKQVLAIQKANEERIKKVCPIADEHSGLYVFYRTDENGIKYAYVGQTKNLLKRMAEHLSGYQHIDLSIKKHKFYDEIDNPFGYHIEIICHCPVDELDSREQYWIKHYANEGFQLRNKTAGGQCENMGSTIGERRPTRGYRDGLSQGYKNASKDVSKLFEKNLTYGINGKPNKNKEKALAKFEAFLNEHKTEAQEDEQL